MRRIAAATVVLLAVLAGAWSAVAATSRVYEVQIVDGGKGPVFVPAGLTMQVGDALHVANQTAASIFDVSVVFNGRTEWGPFRLLPGQDTDSALGGGGRFMPTTPGTRTLLAVQQPTGASIRATVQVTAATTAAPSPTSARSSPPTVSSPAPAPAVAPTPQPRPHPKPNAGNTPASLGPIPSLLASGPPTSGQAPLVAEPSPSPSSGVAVGGPLEPPTHRGLGLPSAVAALLVAGLASAQVRVLLAEPVDGAGRTGPDAS